MRPHLVLTLLIIVITACSSDKSSQNSDAVNNNQLQQSDWDHASDAVLFRLDEILEGRNQATITNRIPLCTIWGDGRVVWVNPVLGTLEILEARLDVEQMRGFVADVVGYGFYGWESDVASPPGDDPARQIITLNVYDNPKTIERYGGWPNEAFSTILEQCRNLSPERALVLPDGGWVRAYPVDYDAARTSQEWPRNAPFSMTEVANEAVWTDGFWAQEIWGYTREINPVQVTERGQTYRVSIQVPGLSRTSPAPPQ